MNELYELDDAAFDAVLNDMARLFAAVSPEDYAAVVAFEKGVL